MPENKCALCRFCLYDRESNNYACHNEESSNFGTILSTDRMQESCEDQNDHEYSMSIKDALEIMVDPDSVKSMFFYHNLPGREGHPFIGISFESNLDLERWRDAHLRLFRELMNIKTNDGDFEEE